jgi:hypothetical protein
MTSLADLQRPEFQNLSPEARTLVFDKIAGQDAGYGKLSAEAQNLVRLKLLGVARGAAMSEIPTAGAPQAPAATPASRMDQFFEGVKQSIPAHLLAGVNRGARDITGTLLSAVGGAPAKAAEAKAKAEYEQRYGQSPLASSARLGTQMAVTAPVGGLVAAPLTKVATMAPSLARFLTPIATALETSGFGQTGLTGVKNVATRAVGGAVPGAISAGLVNPDDAAMGGAISAVVPAVVAPVAKIGLEFRRKVFAPKEATYIQAIEGKGQDILNALRSPEAVIVPGSAPTAAQVAAPVGSARFSALGQASTEVPGMATEFAGQAAQSNAARLAQEAQAQARFGAAMDRTKAKIDRGLTDVSPREVGDSLLGAAKAEQKAVKEGVIQPAYTAAFKEAGDAAIDVSDVVAKAESILERKLSSFAPESAPDTVRKLLSFKPTEPPAQAIGSGLVSKNIKGVAPEAGPPTATLQQLDDLRKAVNADIAAAKLGTQPMSPTALRNLYDIHGAIDDAVGKSTTLPDVAKEAYAKAVNLYRTEYVPRFKTGVNANLFKQTALNEPRVNADDVITKFFSKDGEREAGQFVDLFGKNPDAMKVARSGIEDLYRRKVTDEVGNVIPSKQAQFMKDYARPLGILDDAGMNLTQRLDVINKDAARLARINQMAKDSGNKLRPPLPPGANALAVEQRIADLTKNMTPQQLAKVNLVRADLAREAEYESLAKAGRPAGPTGERIATEVGKQAGLPLPSFLNRTITVFNGVFKQLSGSMDEKMALELAREMSSPALAAAQIESAMANRAKQDMTNALLRRAARPATAGGILANTENNNALAPAR